MTATAMQTSNAKLQASDAKLQTQIKKHGKAIESVRDMMKYFVTSNDSDAEENHHLESLKEYFSRGEIANRGLHAFTGNS